MGCSSSMGRMPKREAVPQDLASYVADALERLAKDEAVIPCEQTGAFHGNSGAGSLRGFSSAEAKRQWFGRHIQRLREKDCNILEHWQVLDVDFVIKHAGLAGAVMPPARKLQVRVREQMEQQASLYAKALEDVTSDWTESLSRLMSRDALWPPIGSPQEIKRRCLQPEEAMTTRLNYAVGVKSLELLYQFTAGLARIARLDPGQTVSWHVKRPVRLWAKANLNFPEEFSKNDVRNSTDVYRTSIVAQHPSQLEQMLDLLECLGRDQYKRQAPLEKLGIRSRDHFVVERIKNRFAVPAVGGYPDIIVNLRINGYVSEIQLHVAGLLALQGEGGRALAKWFKHFDREGASEGAQTVDGKMQGKGIVSSVSGGRYSGDFLNGKRHGKGVLFYNSGDRYEGDFLFGLKQGTGTYFYASGDRYHGSFMEDRMHGQGTYYAASGECYEGEFSQGMRHGMGTFYGADSSIHEGMWWQNKRVTIESV